MSDTQEMSEARRERFSLFLFERIQRARATNDPSVEQITDVDNALHHGDSIAAISEMPMGHELVKEFLAQRIEMSKGRRSRFRRFLTDLFWYYHGETDEMHADATESEMEEVDRIGDIIDAIKSGATSDEIFALPYAQVYYDDAFSPNTN